MYCYALFFSYSLLVFVHVRLFRQIAAILYIFEARFVHFCDQAVRQSRRLYEQHMNAAFPPSME